MIGMTTAQAYAAWARKNHAEVLTDELPEGAKLHWVGPRREDRVILYFHGAYTFFFLQLQLRCFEPGRWALQAEDLFSQLGRTTLRCLRSFKRIARMPSESPSSTTVRSSDKHEVDHPSINRSPTALIPEYPFPTQLRQATAAVQHLLDKGMSPSNIIIAGDSAGGNLALQLASLLLHPHPSLPLPPRLDPPGADAGPSSSESQQPFGGLLLISPGVGFSTDAPSYVRNSARDLIPVSAYRLFSETIRALIPPALRYYFEPCFAPRGWWTGLGRVFPRVLVTAGEYEIPLDPIQASAAAISEEVRDTTVFVLPGGVHEDFMNAFASGEGGRGDDYKLVVSWLSETFNL